MRRQWRKKSRREASVYRREGKLAVVGCQLSVVGYRLAVGSCWLFIVGSRLSVAVQLLDFQQTRTNPNQPERNRANPNKSELTQTNPNKESGGR